VAPRQISRASLHNREYSSYIMIHPLVKKRILVGYSNDNARDLELRDFTTVSTVIEDATG
jgi:hypothetical protein